MDDNSVGMVGSRGADDHNSSATSMVGSRDGSEHNSPGFGSSDSGGTTDATDSIDSSAPPAGPYSPSDSPDVGPVGKQPGTDDHNSEWLNGRAAT